MSSPARLAVGPLASSPGAASDEKDDDDVSTICGESLASFDDLLMCVKCDETTTMTESSASGGRNPLRRVCRMCASTDRCVQRDKDLQKVFKAAKGKDKMELYRGEKRKLEQKETTVKARKRDFSDVKLGVAHVQREETLEDEIDFYRPFSVWGPRQIQLGLAGNIKEAKAQFVLRCEDASCPKIKRRGQWCLGEFDGVALTKRKAEGIES